MFFKSNPLKLESNIEVLQQAREERIPFVVEHPSIEQQYYFLLHEINVDKKELIFTSLIPNNDTKDWSKRAELNIQSSTGDGKVISTKGKLRQIESSGTYTIKLISEINIIDRRNDYRVKVGFSKIVPITLITVPKFKPNDKWTDAILEGNKQYEGHLCDISETGLQISFSENLSSILKVGSYLTTIIEDEKSSFQFTCQITIRWVSYNKKLNKTYIGGEYLVLDKGAKSSLGSYISKLQAMFYHREL